MHAEFIFLFLLFSFCTVHVVHTDQDGYVHSCETGCYFRVFIWICCENLMRDDLDEFSQISS